MKSGEPNARTLTLRERARALKADTLALWFCVRHPRTPLSAKIVGALVVAYALSPLDLIPDFIPVLGYLDDIVIVPAGILLTLALVPDDVLEECRAEAREWLAAGKSKPKNYLAAALIVAIWAAALWLTWRWLSDLFG